jgi:hypothetical protein
VDSICEFDGIDAVEAILSGIERKIKENNLQHQLRLQLRKVERALHTVKAVKRDLEMNPDLASSTELVSLT